MLDISRPASKVEPVLEIHAIARTDRPALPAKRENRAPPTRTLCKPINTLGLPDRSICRPAHNPLNLAIIYQHIKQIPDISLCQIYLCEVAALDPAVDLVLRGITSVTRRERGDAAAAHNPRERLGGDELCDCRQELVDKLVIELGIGEPGPTGHVDGRRELIEHVDFTGRVLVGGRVSASEIAGGRDVGVIGGWGICYLSMQHT
jgi:hypothetical protein